MERSNYYQFSFLRLISDIMHIPRPIPATPLIATAPYVNILPITVGTDVSADFLLFELPKATKIFYVFSLSLNELRS